MPKETSEEVSAIAAKYMQMGHDKLYMELADADDIILTEMVDEILALAASCLSQRSDADAGDETEDRDLHGEG